MHVNGFKALMLKVFKLSYLRNFITERFLASSQKKGMFQPESFVV